MNVKATLRTAEQGMKLMELNEKMGQDESMPTFSYHLDYSNREDRSMIHDLCQLRREYYRFNTATKLILGLIVYLSICTGLIAGYFLS